MSGYQPTTPRLSEERIRELVEQGHLPPSALNRRLTAGESFERNKKTSMAVMGVLNTIVFAVAGLIAINTFDGGSPLIFWPSALVAGIAAFGVFGWIVSLFVGHDYFDNT